MTTSPLHFDDSSITAEPAAESRLRRIGTTVLRCCLCALLLGYVISQVSWHDHAVLVSGERVRLVPDAADPYSVMLLDGTRLPASEIKSTELGLASLFRQVDPTLAAVAVLLTMLVPLFSSLRLKLLLEALGLTPGLGRVTNVTLLGYVFNLIGLGSLGGDAYRAIALRRDSDRWLPVITGLFADRVSGLIALITYAAIASVFCLFHPQLAWLARLTLAGCACGLLILAILGPRRLYRLAEKYASRDCAGRLQHLLINACELLREPRSLLRIMLASMFVQAANLGAMAVLAESLGIPGAFAVAFLLIPGALIVSVVTPTPQGLGALEGVLVVILAPLVPGGANTCLLYALGIRLLNLLWAVPGAGLLLSQLVRRVGEPAWRGVKCRKPEWRERVICLRSRILPQAWRS